ncbi:MGMT family protein [Porticoccaceae bacterium LTM1]|nr:MGMT family protein [Porticoccaceae bacterium LTM1]
MEQLATPQQRIYAVLRSIPTGKVATYGQVAELAGLPRAARLVGTTLKKLPNDSTLPWHRVINAAGKISFPSEHPGHTKQRGLLLSEGVLFSGDKVNLRIYQWQP